MTRDLLKHIALILWLLTATAPAFAQVMMPAANSNRTEMLIGEQAKISLSIELTRQDEWPKIDFPYKQDELTEGLEIVEVTPVDTVQPDESNPQLYQLRQHYTVTAFDSGFYAIDPIPVVVNNDTMWSNRLQLAVHTVEVDTTQTAIFDIKDIYDVELTWKDYFALYWWIGALVLLGIALIILGIYFWKRRQRQPAAPVVKPEPKIPPHEIALAALQQLEAEKAWQNRPLKTYHTDLTDILREYIEGRYKVPAHEQTSNEVLQNLRFAEMGEEATMRLRHVLRLADMVKFAKEHPGAAENERSLQFAKDFVTQTKPSEPSPAKPEGKTEKNTDNKPDAKR